jgi:hypothetical protein
MTERKCTVCGGPLFKRNKTGICTKNETCIKANRQVHDGTFRGVDKIYGPRRHHSEKEVRNYPAHPWMLHEDGIVDEIAIEIAVTGKRKVRLTQTEQKRVIERMLRLGYGRLEIRNNLGIGAVQIDKLLDEMGYEIIRDPTQVSAKYPRKLITRKDRPRRVHEPATGNRRS